VSAILKTKSMSGFQGSLPMRIIGKSRGSPA
jgi:hypothetical protein